MDTSRTWCACAVDGGVAIGVAIVATLAALVAGPSFENLDLFAHVLLVVASLSLVVRRRYPRTVLVVAATCVLIYQAKGYPGLITTLPVLVAVYTAVSAGHRRATVAIVAAGLGVTSLAVSTLPSFDRPMRDLAEAKFLLVGWLLAGGVMAEMSKHRHAYVQQVEERAAEAERTREETARRRATDERLRIARELHDSLTHSISIVKVQAGVAIHLARKRGENVPESLLAIEDASSEAIRELRSTLDVLRRTDDDDEQTASGVDRLGDLVERARSAGLDASLALAGHEQPLAADVDGAVYRIVQESLTNVWRHAGASAAEVRVEYGDDELTVQIDDDGHATPAMAPIPGVGLIGMRERVTALGGRLWAGPRASGGFRVEAMLPLSDALAPASVATPTPAPSEPSTSAPTSPLMSPATPTSRRPEPAT